VHFSTEEHYRPASGLPLEDYILLGGLCQGINLGYSLESMRANEQTMGGIFWMVDDAWGENGWSIIDYYLRRKVSYYEVKRRLAPVRLVLRAGGQAFGGKPDDVLLIGLNEGQTAVSGRGGFGYLPYDGRQLDIEALEFSLAPHSRSIVSRFSRPGSDKLSVGTVVAIPRSGFPVEPVAWKHCFFREMGLLPADVTIVKTERVGNDLAVTVRTDRYAHAVHFGWSGDVRLSDSFFDLLPGEERQIMVFGQGNSSQPVCCNWVNQS
jgi:beta-mannosidase